MSGAVKLTKAQQALLDAITAGVEVHFFPYAGTWNPKEYYIRWDTHARCTVPARALFALGLVEKFDDSWRGHKLRLTK
jgi:hypothetical protein